MFAALWKKRSTRRDAKKFSSVRTRSLRARPPKTTQSVLCSQDTGATASGGLKEICRTVLSTVQFTRKTNVVGAVFEMPAGTLPVPFAAYIAASLAYNGAAKRWVFFWVRFVYHGEVLERVEMETTVPDIVTIPLGTVFYSFPRGQIDIPKSCYWMENPARRITDALEPPTDVKGLADERLTGLLSLPDFVRHTQSLDVLASRFWEKTAEAGLSMSIPCQDPDFDMMDVMSQMDPDLFSEYIPQSMVHADQTKSNVPCAHLCNIDQLFQQLGLLGICLECLSSSAIPVRCTSKCAEGITLDMIRRARDVVAAMVESKTEEELEEILQAILDPECRDCTTCPEHCDFQVNLYAVAKEVLKQCVDCRAQAGICQMPSVEEVNAQATTLRMLQNPSLNVDDSDVRMRLDELKRFVVCIADVLLPTLTPVNIRLKDGRYLGFEEPKYTRTGYADIPHEMHVLREDVSLEVRFADRPEPWYMIPLPINRKAFVLCPARFWTHCIHPPRSLTGGGRVKLQSRTFSDLLNRLPLFKQDLTGMYYITEVTREYYLGEVDGYPEWLPNSARNWSVDTFFEVASSTATSVRFNLVMNPYKTYSKLDQSSRNSRWSITELRDDRYFTMSTSSSNIWNFDIIHKMAIDFCDVIRECDDARDDVARKLKILVLCAGTAILAAPPGFKIATVVASIVTCLGIEYLLSDACTQKLYDLLFTALELIFTDTIMSWRLNVDEDTSLRIVSDGGDTMVFRIFPSTNVEAPLGYNVVDRLEELWDKITFWKDNGVDPENVFQDTTKRRYGNSIAAARPGSQWKLEKDKDANAVREQGVLGTKMNPAGAMQLYGIQPGTAGLVLGHARDGDNARYVYWRSITDTADLLQVRIRRHRLTKQLVIGMLCQMEPGVCRAAAHPEFDQMRERLDTTLELVKQIRSTCGDGCTIQEALKPFCDKAGCDLDDHMRVFCRSSQARQLDQIVCTACQRLGYPCEDDRFCARSGSLTCSVSHWQHDPASKIFSVRPKGFSDRFLYGTAAFVAGVAKNIQIALTDIKLSVAPKTTAVDNSLQWLFYTRLGHLYAYRHMDHAVSDRIGYLSKSRSPLTIVETGVENTFVLRFPAGGYLAYNGDEFETTDDRYHIYAQWLFQTQTAESLGFRRNYPIYDPNWYINLASPNLSNAYYMLEFIESYAYTASQLGTYLEANARGTKNLLRRVSVSSSTDGLVYYWKAHCKIVKINNSYGYLGVEFYCYDADGTKKYMYIHGELTGSAGSKRNDSSDMIGMPTANVVILNPTGAITIGFLKGSATSLMTSGPSFTWRDATTQGEAYPKVAAFLPQTSGK